MDSHNKEPEPMDTEPEPMDTEETNQRNDLNTNENEMQFKRKVDRKKERQQNKEKKRENTMTSGYLLISAFMDLLKDTEVIYHYMDRVLHSIFFFGHINCPPIAPDEFIPEEYIEDYKEAFPKPFEQYDTHLPRYTPYSILLEYMTNRMEWEDLDSLSKKLEDVNKSLLKSHDEREDQYVANDFAFNASAVTFCCVKDSNDAKVLRKAYGSSLSCKGKTERKLMIAISALHVWDRAVSYAVCCAGKAPITFPKRVHCTTYSFIKRKTISPCNHCYQMYIADFSPEHEEHDREEHWPYGNCAENESFSRLLQADEDVRKEIFITNEKGQKLNNTEDIEQKFREEHEMEMKKWVRSNLAPRKFKLPREEWNFFTPDQSI